MQLQEKGGKQKHMRKLIKIRPENSAEKEVDVQVSMYKEIICWHFMTNNIEK